MQGKAGFCSQASLNMMRLVRLYDSKGVVAYLGEELWLPASSSLAATTKQTRTSQRNLSGHGDIAFHRPQPAVWTIFHTNGILGVHLPGCITNRPHNAVPAHLPTRSELKANRGTCCPLNIRLQNKLPDKNTSTACQHCLRCHTAEICSLAQPKPWS